MINPPHFIPIILCSLGFSRFENETKCAWVLCSFEFLFKIACRWIGGCVLFDLIVRWNRGKLTNDYNCINLALACLHCKWNVHGDWEFLNWRKTKISQLSILCCCNISYSGLWRHHSWDRSGISDGYVHDLCHNCFDS